MKGYLMDIILEPEVEVIGSSVFYGSDKFEIPEDGDEHTKIGAFAAKVCYDSSGRTGRPNTENQRKVIQNMHGSVLEHMSTSLYITGITRGLTLELNRHRTFAISQRSTRYAAENSANLVLEPYLAFLFTKFQCSFTDASGLVAGMRPEGAQELMEYNLIVNEVNSFSSALKYYNNQVETYEIVNPNNLTGFDLRKWARGKARNVLPHGLETRGVWTNNHRGWRWFIQSRSERHAEPEIRRLADVVYKALKEVAPVYYEDFTVSDIVDGYPEYVTKYSKI